MGNILHDLAQRRDAQVMLYVVECAGFYKIGFAKDVERRVRDFKIGNPLPIRIVLRRTVRGADINRAERQVHEVLADYRLEGEWFDAPIGIIRGAIKSVVARTKRAEVNRMIDARRALLKRSIRVQNVESS